MSARSTCLSRFGGLAAGQEDEQKRYFRQKRLYTLQVESTAACRQGCVYCYTGSKAGDAHGLSSDEIRALLRDAAGLEIRAIDWLGGDPLERADWYELMVEARSLGLINNVWTSGLPLRHEPVARRVVEVTEGGFVSVHVDSIVPETYARLHRGGDARNIALIVRGVDNLLALATCGQDVQLHHLHLAPAAGGRHRDHALVVRREGHAHLSDHVQPRRHGRGGAGPRAQARGNQAGLPGARRHQLRGRRRFDRGHGYGQVLLRHDGHGHRRGDVTPCSVIRDGVGNIRMTPFSRIVAEQLGMLTHAALHDTQAMPAPCDNCRNNSHCWGCRASAYHYGGDANGLDPKCWLIGGAQPLAARPRAGQPMVWRKA